MLTADTDSLVGMLDELLAEKKEIAKSLALRSSQDGNISGEPSSSSSSSSSGSSFSSSHLVSAMEDERNSTIRELLQSRLNDSRARRLKEIEDMIEVVKDELNRLTASVDLIPPKKEFVRITKSSNEISSTTTKKRRAQDLVDTTQDSSSSSSSDIDPSMLTSSSSSSSGKENGNGAAMKYRKRVVPGVMPMKKTRSKETENEIVVATQIAARVMQAAGVDQRAVVVSLCPTDIGFHLVAKVLYGAEGTFHNRALCLSPLFCLNYLAVFFI